MAIPKGISNEDIRACKALFDKDPDTIKKLTNYPDPIGKIAKMCVDCAGQVI